MWEKLLYIAKRNRIETNVYGEDIEYFDQPKAYRFNYQPIDGELNVKESGERKSARYQAFVDRRYFQGVIKSGDKAYLSDEDVLEKELEDLVSSDNEYCEKANYRIIKVLTQNFKMRIVFEKL